MSKQQIVDKEQAQLPTEEKQHHSIFDDMELGTWPTRTAVTKRDRLDKHLQLLHERCNYQVDLLNGNADHRKRSWRKWWAEEFLPDGSLLLSCRFEVAGKTVVMKGQPCAKYYSHEEAIEFYYTIASWCLDGGLDEVVTNHLASIPPRKRRLSPEDSGGSST